MRAESKVHHVLEGTVLHVREEWGEDVGNRLKKDDWIDVQEGDWVLAFRKDGQGEFMIFEVIERRDFPGFRAALEGVGFENAVPYAENLEEALEEYFKIYGGQNKMVLALRIRTMAEFCGKISPEKLEKYLANFRGDVA